MTKKDKQMIKNATLHMMDQYIGHFALFKLPPRIPFDLDPPDLDPLISPLSYKEMQNLLSMHLSGHAKYLDMNPLRTTMKLCHADRRFAVS